MTKPISIAVRLHPFSHLPGIEVPLPGTFSSVKCFPTLIRFYDLSTSEKKLIKEIKIPIQGPIEDFTVELDIERKKIGIWGKGKEGFFRYALLPNQEMIIEKGLPGVREVSIPHHAEIERLSLGSHKKQEWEAIRKRLDLTEIFPLWFQLGSMLHTLPPLTETKGMFSLLQECQKVIEEGHPERILVTFRTLFLVGFEGMMVPRLQDTDYQGILSDPVKLHSSPFHLLAKGASLIRSLFFKENEDTLSFLPHLPPQFFSGRMTAIQTSWGRLDFEWTKKLLRRVSLKATKDGELLLDFPLSLKRFRLRHSLKDKGKIIETRKRLEIKSGTTYLLDRFEK